MKVSDFITYLQKLIKDNPEVAESIVATYSYDIHGNMLMSQGKDGKEDGIILVPINGFETIELKDQNTNILVLINSEFNKRAESENNSETTKDTSES